MLMPKRHIWGWQLLLPHNIHNEILFNHKKEWNTATCDKMDHKNTMLSEISQTEQRNTEWSHIHTES